MWNTPSKERLIWIPDLFGTDDAPLQDKLIYLHFLVSGCDWFVCEYDGSDLFWGFAILNCDYRNAEWGYFSLTELKEIRLSGWMEIDCELEEHWEVRPAFQVEKICQAQGWNQQALPVYSVSTERL